MGLFEWLRDKALVSDVNVTPARGSLAAHFGTASLSYQRDIAALKSLYSECAAYETIRIKRRLWHDLLRTALGEIAGSPEELDDLFVRHTYLSAVVAMVVQATFGIDIYQKAETDPADLLHGRQFHSDTGLQGVVESDFFTLAHRGRRSPFPANPGPPGGPVRLAGSPARRGRHPVRDGDSTGGTAPTGGVLHSRLAGADNGQGAG